MNKRTTQALKNLFDKIEHSSELRALYGVAQDAVNMEISGYSDALNRRVEREPDFVRSVGGRRVLERAWAADPKATELDLIAAGARDLASTLGAWWLAEESRRRRAGAQAVAQ